jgi:hypothetical protein
MRAKSTDQFPTHHIKLTDTTGVEVGLILSDRSGQPDPTAIAEASNPSTALQISQGNNGYDDLLAPYSPIVQNSWLGGRGQEDYERDSSKYWDANRLDTIRGNLILGPKETYTTGYYSTYATGGSTAGDHLLYEAASVKFAASSITFGATVRSVRFRLKTVTGATYPLTLTAYIYNDSSGPNVLQATSDPRVFESGSLTSSYQNFDFIFPPTVLGSAKYWIALGITSGAKVYVEKHTNDSTNTIYKKTTGAWSSETASQGLNISVNTTGTGYAHFFDYKGQLYCATSPDDSGAAGRLFMNGYRGIAATTFTDKYVMNTASLFGTDDLSGKILKITAGPGSKEEFPYRVIASNTASSITVTQAWKTTFTTATEWVVLGCDTWQQITNTSGGTSPMTAPITSVLVTDDYVYLAQGDAAVIYRYRGYTTGGVWTSEFAADSNKADLLAFYQTTAGARKIVRAVYPNQVSEAAAPTSWTGLSFGTAVKCGSSNSRITGLTIFGTPSCPYVFKEDGFGYISSGIYSAIPLSEMENVANIFNGKASIRHDIYLYFSLLKNGSLERYYNNRIDDMGPSTDAGLPPERQGPVVSLIGYPGRFYAAIDAGDDTDHFSSVLCWNQTGWCEIYRAPGGKRIRKIWIQDIPTKQYQKLWISEEEDLVWIYVAINPLKCDGYQFASSGSIISSWKSAKFYDIKKFFYSEKLFSENLSSTKYVTLEYQTDNEKDSDTWHSAGTFDSSPSEEVVLSALNDVSGIRYRTKLTITIPDNDRSTSPEIKSELLHTVVRQPVKHAWNLTFVVEDQQYDLNGESALESAKEVLDQLKTWAESQSTPCPLSMDCVIPYLDGYSVFVEPASIKPYKVIPSDLNPNKINKMVCTMVLNEA